MTRDIEVSCRCGSVHGRVSGVSPDATNRAVCYCDDCQAFAHWLRRADLLDAHGGSDVAQVAPAAVSFDRGQEHIRAVRLGPKGLYRWYASCCNTPLGNTLKPAIPFVGIPVQAFVGGLPAVDEAFGGSRGGVRGQFAVGTAPAGSMRPSLGLIAHALGRVLSWRIFGKTWPHPFFERATGAPRYPVTTLIASERDALRPLCGPHPAPSGA